MRRIVADTNIYISAYNFGGIPNQVLDLARARRAELFLCAPILNEFRKILRAKFAWSPERIRTVVVDINQFTRIVELRGTITAIKKDDADNRILECAIAADAEIIVTGDSHILELGSFRGIRILTARAFSGCDAVTQCSV